MATAKEIYLSNLKESIKEGYDRCKNSGTSDPEYMHILNMIEISCDIRTDSLNMIEKLNINQSALRLIEEEIACTRLRMNNITFKGRRGVLKRRDLRNNPYI